MCPAPPVSPHLGLAAAYPMANRIFVLAKTRADGRPRVKIVACKRAHSPRRTFFSYGPSSNTGSMGSNSFRIAAISQSPAPNARASRIAFPTVLHRSGERNLQACQLHGAGRGPLVRLAAFQPKDPRRCVGRDMLAIGAGGPERYQSVVSNATSAAYDAIMGLRP